MSVFCALLLGSPASPSSPTADVEQAVRPEADPAAVVVARAVVLVDAQERVCRSPGPIRIGIDRRTPIGAELDVAVRLGEVDEHTGRWPRSPDGTPARAGPARCHRPGWRPAGRGKASPRSRRSPCRGFGSARCAARRRRAGPGRPARRSRRPAGRTPPYRHRSGLWPRTPPTCPRRRSRRPRRRRGRRAAGRPLRRRKSCRRRHRHAPCHDPNRRTAGRRRRDRTSRRAQGTHAARSLPHHLRSPFPASDPLRALPRPHGLEAPRALVIPQVDFPRQHHE